MRGPNPANFPFFLDAAGEAWKLTRDGCWLRFGEDGTFPREAARLPLRRLVPEGYLLSDDRAEANEKGRPMTQTTTITVREGSAPMSLHYRMAVEDDTVVLDRKHLPAIRDALSAAISNTHYDALVKPYGAALEALDGSGEAAGHG